jgi:hypothetical protein
MRRALFKTTGPRRHLPAVWTLLVLVAAVPSSVTTRAQEPQPFYPSVEERSGLLNRFIPIEPWLPPDPHRDTFYDTRFANHPDTHPDHPNIYKNGGGLYGRRWPGYNTATIYPYFYGNSSNTLGPGSKPWPRILKLPQTLLQPFRPVCYYYDQGAYVPLYDLDPLIPGPGPNPYFFPFYLKNPHGG